MVTVGAAAAWSVQHAEKRFSGFGDAMRKAPYVSCVLLTLLAVFMAYSGWHGLYAHSCSTWGGLTISLDLALPWSPVFRLLANNGTA